MRVTHAINNIYKLISVELLEGTGYTRWLVASELRNVTLDTAAACREWDWMGLDIG